MSYKVEQTEEFEIWLSGLKDSTTRLRLARRLARAAMGNLGEVKALGDDVFEMKEDFGPGWRMYYVVKGNRIILMLGGGNKYRQATDISKAKKTAKSL